MKLTRKTFVGVGVTLVLSVLAYFFGPDVVSMVKDQIQVQEVVAPADTSE